MPGKPFGLTRHGWLMQNVAIPMRDGVRLEATVALPAGDGPFPAVRLGTSVVLDSTSNANSAV